MGIQRKEKMTLPTNLPVALIESLKGLPGFDEASFIAVHADADQVSSIRINRAKLHDPSSELLFGAGVRLAGQVPWSSSGWYLSGRPSYTLDPLLHAGCYYVQEASGMFLEQALRAQGATGPGLKVLDLCAAPGGKSTILQSVIDPGSLLVSNEVIKSRASILSENITKWGGANVVVTNNDPAHFARLGEYFDIIMIDAPCSGSGLFRREPALVSEWSPETVELCHQRQQRIIADVYPSLRDGGLLIYATCSYSKAEDEDIVNWVCSTLGAKLQDIPVPPGTGIVTTPVEGGNGYRFYPDKVQGEGFFIACLRKTNGDQYPISRSRDKGSRKTVDKVRKTEIDLLQPWISDPDAMRFQRFKETMLAVNELLATELDFLQQHLYLRQAGIAMGQLTSSALIPDHALAVSGRVSKEVPRVEIDLEQALQYLRRDANFATAGAAKGWLAISYRQHLLGWVKNLGHRINNYYPQEWRVRMNMHR